VFNFIKQSYLLSSRWLLDTVHDVDGLDKTTVKKIDFTPGNSLTPWPQQILR
jgi:polyhydroxyalkanoate synthase